MANRHSHIEAEVSTKQQDVWQRQLDRMIATFSDPAHQNLADEDLEKSLWDEDNFLSNRMKPSALKSLVKRPAKPVFKLNKEQTKV